MPWEADVPKTLRAVSCKAVKQQRPIRVVSKGCCNGRADHSTRTRLRIVLSLLQIIAGRRVDKPVGVWCSHCRVERGGCKIYDTRPPTCRSFHCAWLINPELGPKWRPTTAKMVLYYDHPVKRLAVHVDPSFPSVWRNEPYYRQLKTWTSAAVDSARTRSPHAWLMAPIVVYIKDRAIVVLPNKDIDVGTFTPGDDLVVTERATPSGRDFDAYIVPPKNVPRDQDEKPPE